MAPKAVIPLWFIPGGYYHTYSVQIFLRLFRVILRFTASSIIYSDLQFDELPNYTYQIYINGIYISEPTYRNQHQRNIHIGTKISEPTSTEYTYRNQYEWITVHREIKFPQICKLFDIRLNLPFPVHVIKLKIVN